MSLMPRHTTAPVTPTTELQAPSAPQTDDRPDYPGPGLPTDSRPRPPATVELQPPFEFPTRSEPVPDEPITEEPVADEPAPEEQVL